MTSSKPIDLVVRRATIFQTISPSDCSVLTMCFRERRYRAGETVFRFGDPGATMLLVGEGTLIASVPGKDGAMHELNRMGSGEVVGEMAFLDPAPRSATVVAETDALVYELDHDAMGVLRARAPAAAGAIVDAVIHDVRRRLRGIDAQVARELAARANAMAAPSGRGGR